MTNKLFLALFSFCSLLYGKDVPILTLDSLADVYYDKETGDAIVADEIKALNGKEVRLAGYMVPFNDLENLKEFMLMPSSNGCNFCESPMKEEMVYVRQPGKKKYDFSGDPLVVTGKLWVQGAGTPAPNSTYAQFLYALQDAKVEKLKSKDHALLQVVTPRTIIKQVCSLLRVRLLKQVTFVPQEKEDFVKRREEMLLKYFGGEEGLKNVQLLINTFGLPGAESLLPKGAEYLANWSAAFCNPDGDTIYYDKDLDLAEGKNQLQIAIACYDLLFAQEVNLHNSIHQGNPSYDELFARLSLILGLRQSFSQFYGSIGLIDMIAMEAFAEPYSPTSLPQPYSDIAFDLLVKTQPLIEGIYKSEQYQPYTKAIESPPISSAQIVDPTLYLNPDTTYIAPQLSGYENRFGPYLASKLLGLSIEEMSLKADGVRFTENGFSWELLFSSEEKAKAIAEKLKSTKKATVELKGDKVLLKREVAN